MAIFTLSYCSRSLVEDHTMDSAGEISALVEAARIRNKRLGITGALLFNEGLFAQILEGVEAAVLEVFDLIKSDRRHTDISVLPTQLSTHRRFERWSMAFVGTSLGARDYYKDFQLNSGFEWTKATCESLSELLLALIQIERETLPPNALLKPDIGFNNHIIN